MSILIPDIKMPSSCNGCWNCDINNMDGSEAKQPYFCLIKMKFVEEDFETCRPKWCPLIEVPDGHGRLIDADALLASENQHYEYRSDSFYVETRTIELAPTIIEGENGI